MSLWLPDDDVLIGDPDRLKVVLARYRRVLECSGYAFWEWGLHDNTYFCGGSFWDKLGHTQVDESVTNVDHVQDYVHPDDFDYVNNVVVNHLRFNTPIDMVYRIKARDGSYWWTQACASSTRNAEGRVTYLSGVNFDLSHLKETEKALRLSEARHERILASSNDGIWEWSASDAVEAGRAHIDQGQFHTSHSCWAHLGYSEEEVDSLPEDERLSIWRSHIHPHDLPQLYRSLRRHFIQRKTFDIEYRMIGQDGEMFWMRSRGQAFFNNKNRAISMSGINIDITELKKAQERVRKAKEDAEKANKAKSDFLSSMSHELRTPLNAILGFSQLSLYDDRLSDEQRDNAKQIHSAGEHLLQLINDVLDLSKVEAGKMSLSFEPVLPFLVVNECFALIKAMANKRSISLLSKTNNLDGVFVRVDVVRLKQCLLNIISNAVKYNTDHGQVCVVFNQNENILELRIEDTGPGIPENKQAELFQPFNRLGNESSVIEGSGIGLVITKDLVEMMGGQLEYCNESGAGACFVMSFPILENQSVASPELLNELKVNEPPDLALNEAKHLLYVEDNESNIYLMEELLKPYRQITMDSCGDVFTGLYNARTHLPDLIILDINLPDISGLDLVKVLKADVNTRHIPVVALSANAMETDIAYGKSCGFDDYLTKPLGLGRLISILNRVLANKAA